MKSKLSKRDIKFELLSGDRLDFVAKSLECLLQFVSEFSLRLFGGQIVSVVHVLVFAQIRRDFANLSVELDVQVLLLAKHDGILKKGEKFVIRNCKTRNPLVK